jgi:hypothetical protein
MTMNRIGLLSLLLMANLSLFAQHKQLIVFPFKPVAPLSTLEAEYVRNYTIVQIEELNKFDILRQDTLPVIQGKGSLSITGIIKDSSGVNNTEPVHDYVTGVVQRNADSYSIDFSVGDDNSGDVSKDHVDLPILGNGTQKAFLQRFLKERSGLSGLIESQSFLKSFLKPPDYGEFGAGLSVSYATNPYYGNYVINRIQPLSLMLDISLASNVFMILGGSYVSQNTELKGNNPSNSAGTPIVLDSIIGKHDYYTAKAGLGIRFWKLQVFSTYDRNIAKDIDKEIGNNELLPSWNLTIGMQWYFTGRFYLGTEIYIYKPVDYNLSESQTLIPAMCGTSYFPAICIGLN